MLALRWSDLNIETGILQIRRDVAKMQGIGYVERETKTKAGQRKIMLARVVLEALKEHQVGQQRDRAKAGEKWREQGLIFCNSYGGFFDADHVWLLFKNLLKKADLPDVRFHDLRHSVATILLAAKIDLKVVSELLGA